jgi:catechol 2,3-dioxygenase-like lactoylglutathione lyase family enzyme
MLEGSDFWATIPASDFERAKRFYRETLGLTPVKETDQWATYRAGSTFFQVYPTSSAGTARHTLGGWRVQDLRSAVRELRERGVRFEEYDFPGLKTEDGIARLGDVELAAWFKDSEGNILAVSQFLVEPTGQAGTIEVR